MTKVLFSVNQQKCVLRKIGFKHIIAPAYETLEGEARLVQHEPFVFQVKVVDTIFFCKMLQCHYKYKVKKLTQRHCTELDM